MAVDIPATSDNIPGTVVLRDASGNLSAGQITANVIGNLTGTASAIADNTVTSAKIVNDTIVNADIKSDAAIAGTKISPDFGAQNVKTTGNVVAGDLTAAAGKIHARSDGNEVKSMIVLQNRDAGAFAGSAINFVNSTNDLGDDRHCFIRGIVTGAGQNGNHLIFGTNADGNPPSERLRIASTGNVLIGTTTVISASSGSNDGLTVYGAPSAGGNFQASNNGFPCAYFRRRTSNGGIVGFFRDTTEVGSISVTTTATAYNTSSDYRLKENSKPLIGGLEVIDRLLPVEFDWKGHNEKGRGFIAHELQAVVPEAVTGEKDAVDADGNPQYQGVDAAKLVPYLVSAVKEIKTRVEALEAA